MKCAVCPKISQSDRKPQCGIFIGYSINKTELYLSVKKYSCLERNISLSITKIFVNQHGSFQTFVRNKSGLHADESDYLYNESPNRTPIPSIRLHMSRIFGNNKYYGRNLLHQILRKGRKNYLGTDVTSMEKFFTYCENVHTNGRNFLARYCPTSLKLTGHSLQHPLEIKLVKTYGKLLLLSTLLPILLSFI